MQPGQSQFHDDYRQKCTFTCIIKRHQNYQCNRNHEKCERSYHAKPYRFRIIWSREFLQPESIKGYYIVETKVLDNYKPGDVSPMAGLKMFEL